MSDTLLTAFFVYGTLQRQQLRGGCWPFPPLRISSAAIAGELYDLGPYPAAVAGEGMVLGELWEFAASQVEETLAVLDAIEGYRGPGQPNLYEREEVPVYAAELMQARPMAVAYCYMMKRLYLPHTAISVPSPARWPVDDVSPAITSRLPDPFPDDLPY